MEQSTAVQRAIRILAAVLLIVPGVSSGLAGGGPLAGCVFLNWQTRRRRVDRAAEQSIFHPKEGRYEQEIDP